jgi:uncharacterized protein HemY
MDRAALENMVIQGQDNALMRYTLGSICLKEKRFEAAEAHLRLPLEMDEWHSASWKQCPGTDATEAYRCLMPLSR